MNNSSPQAQLFFSKITSSSQIQGLTINAVTGCDGDEEVTGPDAVPPSNYVDSHGNRLSGMAAIESDMEDPFQGCVAHH